MGTYYEIHCRACGASGGIYADRRPFLAEEALVCASAFAEMGKALERHHDGDPSRRSDVDLGGCDIDLAFFRAHEGHPLHVIDGYGLMLGQCRNWIAGHPCARPDRHEGPCTVDGPFRSRNP